MSWDKIKELVAENEGVHTVSMEQLRDATGKDKLGKHVISEIRSSLAGMGLGHVPKELPRYQGEQVRLYSRGTAIGEFIESVLSPGVQNDSKLRESFNSESSDYQSIIEQIRDLVGE